MEHKQRSKTVVSTLKYEQLGWSSLENGKKYCSEMKILDPCCKKLMETVESGVEKVVETDESKVEEAITWWLKLAIEVGSRLLLSIQELLVLFVVMK